MGQMNLKKSDVYDIALEILRDFFIIQMGDNWKSEVIEKAREKVSRNDHKKTYEPILSDDFSKNGNMDITTIFALLYFDFPDRCRVGSLDVFKKHIETIKEARNDISHCTDTSSFSENKLISNGLYIFNDFLNYLKNHWDYEGKDEFITKYRNIIGGNIDYIKTIDNARLKDKVKNNDPKAQLEMFIRMTSGVVSDNEYDKWDLLEASANAGLPEAKARLALHILLKKDLSNDDIDKALSLITPVENDSPFAKYVLGRITETGVTDEKPDLEKAYQYYCESAELGCEEAAVRRAYFLARGIGTSQTLEKRMGTVQLKNIARNTKNSYAYELLGMYYYETEQYADSFSTFKEGAEITNDVYLEFRLAECYYGGIGTEKNYKKAFDLFNKASANGNLEAKYKLGLCYYCGHGTTKDETKAFNLFAEVAEKGNAAAKYYLGLCYYYGYGTEKNGRMAYENFAQTANERSQAMCMLGLCCLNGVGTDKNEKIAFKCFETAAERGSNVAQGYLGKCYYFAYGTNKNLDKAINCFDKAAANNDIESEFMLGVCYQEKRQKEEAIRHYKKAAENGHKRAKNFLEYFQLSKKGISDNNLERFKLLFSNGINMAKKDIIDFLYSRRRYEELETICLENKWFSELTDKYFNDVLAWTSITKLQTYDRTIKWLNKAKALGYNNADDEIIKANEKFKKIELMFGQSDRK